MDSQREFKPAQMDASIRLFADRPPAASTLGAGTLYRYGKV
jgi:hypothetical protein